MLGHVPDDLPDLPCLRDCVHPENGDAAARGREDAEHDLDQGALPGPVCPNEPDDSGLDGKGEPLEGLHGPVVLGKADCLDQSHGRILSSRPVRHVIITADFGSI